MTAIATLHDLMVHQLRDIYSAEKQLVTALPKVAKKAHAPELAAAIRTHLAQTEQHVQRLEQVFQELGESPRGVTCKGMKGLIEESDELLGEEVDPSVLDAGIIADAQRIEHYEIAAYGTVCEYARSMGHTSAQCTHVAKRPENHLRGVLPRLDDIHVSCNMFRL